MLGSNPGGPKHPAHSTNPLTSPLVSFLLIWAYFYIFLFSEFPSVFVFCHFLPFLIQPPIVNAFCFLCLPYPWACLVPTFCSVETQLLFLALTSAHLTPYFFTVTVAALNCAWIARSLIRHGFHLPPVSSLLMLFLSLCSLGICSLNLFFPCHWMVGFKIYLLSFSCIEHRLQEYFLGVQEN